MQLSGPTAMPRGQVNDPGSLPRPPNWNNCCLFRKYNVLGEVPTPDIPAAVGEVGELSPFFESSSDEAISLACRIGKPRLNRRVVLDAVEDGVELLANDVPASRESFEVLFPYLFFRYLAHELRASPSCLLLVTLAGEVSRDFKTCDDRLLLSSDGPVEYGATLLYL